jgi:hypothetical protein
MKVRINITIDQEAVDILNQQENKSQYIEDLILNKASQTQSGLTRDDVIQLIKEYTPTPQLDKSSNSSVPNLQTADKFVPKPPDPEFGYPCCKGRSPCKHWVWNEMDSNWTNTLTGKVRDA